MGFASFDYKMDKKMIKVYNDKYDLNISKFRNKVLYEDCFNFPIDCLNNNYSYKSLKNIVDNKTFEDGYRFSKSKFENTNFHHILGYVLDDNFCSFSGSVLCGKYLKFGVYHYTLKKYRKNANVRGILYRKNGFLDKHKEIAVNLNCSGIFFTIFPHNSALQCYVNNLLNNKITTEKHDMSNIKFVHYGGKIKFNNVDQELFYLPLFNFNIEELRDSICT